MNTVPLIARLQRPATLLVAAMACGALAWFFSEVEDNYPRFIVTWSVGLAALLLWPGAGRSSDFLQLMRILWCNLGLSAFATLVPEGVRSAVLVLPIIGVLYAGLRLPRSQVVLIAASSWLFYSLLVSIKVMLMPAIAQAELWLAVAFAAVLVGSVWFAGELQQVQESLLRRNYALRDTLERMQALALQDELTGVSNRRSILEVLQRQKALTDRGGPGFTLCYCDLDFFKRVNDVYGHAGGDDVLRRFAQVAGRVVRDVDYVGRMGGEEFVLVLVDADASAAQRVAQRLREGTKQIDPDNLGELELTVSVGVAMYKNGESIDHLLDRADRALYRAKQGGRDQVVLAA